MVDWHNQNGDSPVDFADFSDHQARHTLSVLVVEGRLGTIPPLRHVPVLPLLLLVGTLGLEHADLAQPPPHELHEHPAFRHLGGVVREVQPPPLPLRPQPRNGSER